MAKIFGTLADRKGNVLPNTKVFAEERGNPGVGITSNVSDAFGNFELTVIEESQEYNLFVNAITDVNASNFIGVRISSGTVVASFTLCDDTSFKVEHYGSAEVEPCGEHKSTNHDDITLRTAGFVETVDSFFEFRIGTTNDKLRVTDTGDTFFFDPFPVAGANNSHIGLRQGHDSSIRNFYFGTAKTRFINTDGDFVLSGGSFEDDVVFNQLATFSRTDVGPSWIATMGAPTDLPEGSTFQIPADDVDFVQKKYVDDEIAAVVVSLDKIFEADSSIEVIDLGTGRFDFTLDGTGIARWDLANGFGIGGLITAADLVHLRQSVPTALRVEDTAAGKVSRLGEDHVGAFSSNDFFFRTSDTNTGVIDSSGRWGLSTTSISTSEAVTIGGALRTRGYIHFETKAVPSDPPLEEARLYLKTRNADNNELAVKIKKKVGGSPQIEEVLITCPEGYCKKCKSEMNARNPYLDTRNGKMIWEFLCGHKFEMNFACKEVK